jgi:hypothetical protein
VQSKSEARGLKGQISDVLGRRAATVGVVTHSRDLASGRLSAIVSSTTLLIIAIETGWSARQEWKRLPVTRRARAWSSFSCRCLTEVRGPTGIMIGTNVGAGRSWRASRVDWTTVLMTDELPKPSASRHQLGQARGSEPSATTFADWRREPPTYATVGPTFGFFGTQNAERDALYTPTKFDRDARSIRAHDQRRQRPNLRHRPWTRVPSPG